MLQGLKQPSPRKLGGYTSSTLQSTRLALLGVLRFDMWRGRILAETRQTLGYSSALLVPQCTHPVQEENLQHPDRNPAAQEGISHSEALPSP